MHTISTENLIKKINQKGVQIIDIRPVDNYNGWTITGQKRGGHIPGARSLPFKWSSYIDWIEILRKKEIHPDNEIVIYGEKEQEIKRIAGLFVKSGYNKVELYEKFAEEWLNDPDMPVDKLERYQNLVSPGWLKRAIDGEQVEHFYGDKLVICHGHYRNHQDYLDGHIPGSISLDSLLLEAPETWNRRSPEELKANLEKLGINYNSTVVLYGRFSFPKNDDEFPGSAAGHLGAIRCAFIMLYAGVKDVKILNGGMQSWLDEGYSVTKMETLPQAISDFGADIPLRPELAVDLPQAKEMLASDKADLVCVRSWPEYIGEVSGYNYIEKKGRIPGTVFGNCGSDAYHMENYRNLDHTMLEANEIINQWEEAGIKRENHNAFYCGTGWRGSEAFFNAWLIGWPRVSVFDGGWFEWSNDPDNPYETGDPNS